MNYKTTLKEYAAEMAGNWKKFQSFGWSDKPEMAEDWTIIYTHNRDSDVLEQSNANAIKREMEPFAEGDDPDAVEEHHGHWAVGWVDGWAIRVYGYSKGRKIITKAFEKMYELQKRLLNYPALNEDDWSQREYEEKQAVALQTIQYSTRDLEEAGYEVSDDAPDDWYDHVWGYIQSKQSKTEFERAMTEIEDSGSTTRYGLDAIIASLKHFGWLTEV
jgi:hypothetical protein